MTITLKPMTPEHTAAIVDIWNKEWIDHYPMRERLIRQNIMEDRNTCWSGSMVAWDEAEGRVVGFVAAKFWQDPEAGVDLSSDQGWIHALVVDPACRGCGIGTLLLREAESALRVCGVKQVRIGNDFHWRVVPGIPGKGGEALAEGPEARRWFLTRGYADVDIVYDLLNEYSASDRVELPVSAGVTFRLAKPEDREALNAFMERCFPGRWEYQTKQYWQRGGTGREFVVLVKDTETEMETGDRGEIIGFCRLNDAQSPFLAQNVYWSPLFEQELGGVGPLGIDEQFRGYRYGLSIVQAAIHFLRERGIRHIAIDTTPYVDFYGKLGYRTWKTYWRVNKQLE
ncbi:GNAT family N-acetyltransferase [Paenibacillus koleovorans]|uniref:GNAT family N-acetyltransferase n=1 Tax=Paenibacillus koleovorans TaxID=121608 RepID=UPI001FE72907|nr:GNAT family N-acetyltransferase [Paenibacillus koleovorans]